MMRESLGRPQRAWGVRGNIFSFLLPWNTVMSKLSECFVHGDFREWPLDQKTACEICRVRFVRGEPSDTDKYEELLVRSAMVKGMANIYIQRHLQDLGERPHVLKLHASKDHDNLADRFKEHINRRVDAEYPAAQFGGSRGGIPKTIKEAVLDQGLGYLLRLWRSTITM